MVTEPHNDQLQRDLESGEFNHGVEQRFWALLERDGHVVYMKYWARDGAIYVMQLDCTGYGKQAIGGRFVDQKTRACVSEAWPRGDGTFNGWVKWDSNNLFICWPGDRFGLEHHQDWVAQRAWDKSPNPIVAYVVFIRNLLWNRACGYMGKAA